MNEPFKIPGQSFDIWISFPWERSEVIRVELHTHDGKKVETWVKKIPAEVYAKYALFIPAAKKFIIQLFSR